MSRNEFDTNQFFIKNADMRPLRFNNSRVAVAIAKQKEARERRQALLLVLMMIVAAICSYLLTAFLMSY
jgi:hypothetical protein